MTNLEDMQARIDAIAAYVAQLRKAHKGDDTIGEICDQVELRAWGPVLVDPERAKVKK